MRPLFFSLALAFALSCAGRPSTAVGDPAPEIVGRDLDGVAFKLSDYKGKVVLLDFWGNW